jgi:hypothetical protein
VVPDSRPYLRNGEIQEFEELLTEYEDIFAVDNEDYGETNRVYHSIDTGDARPIPQTQMALSLAKQAEVSEMLDDMQRRGVVEESDSPSFSPVFLVRKKNGELRFCMDYRKLKKSAKKDCFPLSRNDDTLGTLHGAKLFYTLDLKSGYCQVDIHPEDEEKTAFSTGQGLW